jgi:hypothetical protein
VGGLQGPGKLAKMSGTCTLSGLCAVPYHRRAGLSSPDSDCLYVHKDVETPLDNVTSDKPPRPRPHRRVVPWKHVEESSRSPSSEETTTVNNHGKRKVSDQIASCRIIHPWDNRQVPDTPNY